MGNMCTSSDDNMSQASSRTAPDFDHEVHTGGRASRLSRSNSFRDASRRRGTVTRRRVFSSSRLGHEGSDARAPHRHVKSDADRFVVRDALKEQTILSALALYDLDEMIEFMEVVNLKAGQSIDLSGCLCVVLEGSAIIINPTPYDAADPTLQASREAYDAGQVFGQVGLFHDSLRSSNGSMHVLAEGTARICKMSGSAYRMCMEFSRQTRIKANMRLLSSIPIFAKLSVQERVHISDASEVKTYDKGDVIIREGEAGEHFYILRTGGAVVTRGVDKSGNPTRIDYKYAGDYFGEAALLDDAPRNATVVADVARTEALYIGRELFNKQLLGPLKDIMARTETTIQQQMLVAVPLLSQLPADKRTLLAGCLKHETFRDGTFVFYEGDMGDRLFIIKSGEVSVLSSDQRNGNGDSRLNELDHLYKGQYFGERALLNEEPRMASVRAVGKVEVYSLTKADFDNLSLRENVAWSRRWDEEDTRDVSQLKVIKTMGAGAFGTAWLVLHQQTGRGYALKALEKHTVKRQNWTSVVLREKDILASLSPHPCVITMHNSFQSPKQLFMLMELATGGELFQLIEKFERFEASDARFYAGCVVLAIGHLHKHGVIFRDLKPENLLLTDKGYLKLIDMGFAKRLSRGEKAYTLCGTPYYLAPEMIMHRGHGFALDWWTVGVLTYEMIEGDPPFSGTSEMEVYGKVMRMQYTCGQRFPDNAVDFISHLLTKEPESRLGNLRYGSEDVMAHPWFFNLSWDQLLDGTMNTPYTPPPPPEYKPDRLGANGKKMLDLSDVQKNPNDFGYWPTW